MRTILCVACLLVITAPAVASDCALINRVGEPVVTPEGVGTLVSCEPLVVRFKDGSERGTADALPVMHPIPLNSPDWYATALDPNWRPRGTAN